MVQPIYESFFSDNIIIKADTIKPTNALHANRAIDPFYTNALIKLRVVNADDVLFTSTSYYW